LDKQFIQIFKKVINDYGLEICDDTKILNSLLADYSKGEYYKERHLIVWVLEANKNNNLKINMEYDIWKNQCITNLYQNEFIDKKRASWAIDILFGYKYYLDRGFYLIDNSKLDEANISFDNALEINQYSAEAYHGKGIIASKNEDYDNAIKYFENSIQHENLLKSENNEHISDCYYKIGKKYLMNRSFTNAILYFEKAIKLYPKLIDSVFKSLSDAYRLRAYDNHTHKKYYDAINDYNLSMKYLPNNSIELKMNILGDQARAYSVIGDKNNELKNYNEILKIKPDNIEILHKKSKINLK